MASVNQNRNVGLESPDQIYYWGYGKEWLQFCGQNFRTSNTATNGFCWFKKLYNDHGSQPTFKRARNCLIDEFKYPADGVHRELAFDPPCNCKSMFPLIHIFSFPGS